MQLANVKIIYYNTAVDISYYHNTAADLKNFEDIIHFFYYRYFEILCCFNM